MTREFQSIPEFVEFLRTRPNQIEHEQREGIHDAAEKLRNAARDLIGTEDRAWVALAETTVALKQELGYTGRISATDPLLRTGQTRGSIEFDADQTDAVIGSHDTAALEHEHGTEHMPARPTFSTIMFRYGKQAACLIASYVIAALTGSPRPVSDRGLPEDPVE